MKERRRLVLIVDVDVEKLRERLCEEDAVTTDAMLVGEITGNLDEVGVEVVQIEIAPVPAMAASVGACGGDGGEP